VTHGAAGVPGRGRQIQDRRELGAHAAGLERLEEAAAVRGGALGEHGAHRVATSISSFDRAPEE
jgi:hypothetical protein